ncbi:virulence-associated E family protein [Microcoleus sp. D3_18a_C4]|uniref:virulence-associated E family protein n=1 Tax=Microcoleus sp. D3_18a_C4 TaxID=3055332 RepID=UPI002FD2EA23
MKIDRELATQHLSYLGYKPGDSVYLRFFYHSSDPRKKDDSGRKLSKLNWEQIESYQSDGRGVYVVVNGANGGHTDADIKQCCAIFCEWDDIPIAEQFEKWSELGFVEPTFTIFSGGKSMQPYWVFDEPIAVKQWRELQNLLIEVMKTDRSNKNPSRVFRLAGGWHVQPDRKPAKTEVIGDSGIRYNYKDLQLRLVNLLVAHKSTPVTNYLSTHEEPALLATSASYSPSNPTQTPPTLTSDKRPSPFDYKAGVPERYKDVTVPVPIPVPLTCALGKSEDYLAGVSIERNTTMAALARDLIGVQSEFAQLEQTTDDDAYTLFIDACRSCSPGGGWDEHEWEQIWASAMKSSPIASITHHITQGVENCIRGYYWRFLKSQSQAEILPEKTSANSTVNKALESDDKLIQDYNKIASFFRNRIRLNKLTKRIEIDEKPVSIDRAKIQLAVRHGILVKSCKEDVLDIITELAEQNQYSPIENYLSSLPASVDTSILDNLAERYFGVGSAIYQTFVRKTLIGAVARALSPGCKLDTALILQGKQGFKKSTFFKILAGDYFDDSLGAVSDKDERLKLHRAWFVEWSELESIFKRRDVSNTKAFLSSSIDAVRPPYCRDTQDFPRASIIVATTNKDEFLSDETGNRRFWIIPVQKRIDIKLLAKERDAIWAAAVAAYKSGESWWLDYDEELTAETIAQEFQTTDPWLEPIVSYIQHRDCILLGDLLNHLQVDLSRQERAHQMRVTGILKVLGWSKNYRTINGKRCRIWEKQNPEQPSETEKTTPNSEVYSEVVQAETPTPSGFENQAQQVKQLEQPLTPKKVIFSKTDNGVTEIHTAGTDKSESFGDLKVQVDRTDVTAPQQGLQPALPDNCEVDPTEKQSDDEIAELVGFIRAAIAESDRQFAKDIQAIITEVCKSGTVDRKQVWLALTLDEQAALTALLKPIPEAPTETTPETAVKTTSETTPETAVEPALIAPIDAQKIRDIALIWWDEFYSEQTQTLIIQMFGWQSPGTKYDVATINQWLETEDELVRDRIRQLFNLKNNSTEETP